MIEHLTEWLQEPSHSWLYLIPLLAFAESCIGLGLFVSGVFLLSTCTVLYGQGMADIYLVAGLAFLGAVMGDLSGYLSGNLIGPRIRKSALLQRSKAGVARIDALFLRSAPFAICVGRLFPAIRAVTPVVAGVSGMTVGRFVLYDTLACSIWVTGLCLLVTGLSSSLSLF